uniref:Globin family profile domain-containing protein n=1 Tax=Panagrolaimus sp. PS1159 TaxID=55785 RepID=A0AC35GIG8_9BILA
MGNNSSSCSSIRYRTNSISGIFSTSDDSSNDKILDYYQKVILCASWKHMSTKASHGSCGKTVLKRFSLKDSAIKTVFQKFSVIENIFYLQEKGHIAKTSSTSTSTEYCNSFEQHSKIFLDFLQFLMENLDNSKAISEKCEEIGKFHRKFKIFGLKTEHWDLFGESITETVREYQGWRKHRQAVMATNILVSFVIDRIRSGFLQRTEIPSWVKTPHPTFDTETDYAISRKNQKVMDQQKCHDESCH